MALYLVAALAGLTGTRQVLAGAGLPLAVAAAVYTAYLFAQAKARDLWQSPLLPAAPGGAGRAGRCGGDAAAAGLAGARARSDRG